MGLTRDQFVDQFSIAFQVHCVRRWSNRRKEAPVHLARCLREWIRISGGQMALPWEEFSSLTEPVIVELHRVTPVGQRPDARLLAGRLYDALARAGVEMTLEEFEVISAARGRA